MLPVSHDVCGVLCGVWCGVVCHDVYLCACVAICSLALCCLHPLPPASLQLCRVVRCGAVCAVACGVLCGVWCGVVCGVVSCGGV